MRVSPLKMRHYRIDDRFGVGENIVVPESQDCEPLTFQPLRPQVIFLDTIGFIVLSAVNFHDQFGIETDEIDNIISDGLLAAEVPAQELSHLTPQQRFCWRQIASENLSPKDLSVSCTAQYRVSI